MRPEHPANPAHGLTNLSVVGLGFILLLYRNAFVGAGLLAMESTRLGVNPSRLHRQQAGSYRCQGLVFVISPSVRNIPRTPRTA